jgi:hypothetical protein
MPKQRGRQRNYPRDEDTSGPAPNKQATGDGHEETAAPEGHDARQMDLEF